MNRIRAVAVAAALLALVQLVAVAAPAMAATDGFSRLRLTLSTTSDWARVELHDVDIRVHRTASLTPGTKHYAKRSGWTIVPATPAGATAVVDLVVALPDGADPDLLLRKGMPGTASVQLEVTNGELPETVVDEQLDTHDRERNELPIPLDAAALGFGQLAIAPPDPRRLALAFYYPWFGANSRWTVGPDQPVAPYATDRAEGVGGMVDQAQAAGVDGFIVSWSGERHRASVELLLQAAAATPGFLVAPVLELQAFRERSLLSSRFDVDAAAHALRQFFDLAAAGPTLEVGGRRVAFMFGMWDLSPDEWAALRVRVADLDLFLVGDRTARSHPVDGFYDYDPNGLDRSELTTRARNAVDDARLWPAIDPRRSQQLWAATVSPGLDTRATQPLWDARLTPRDGGARYDLTWDVALKADPDWVLITSWNEWYEQTHIAPGTRSGRRALDQTATWTSRF